MEFLFVIFLFSLYFFGFSKTIQWIKSFFVSTVKTAKDINDSGFDTKKIKENFKDEFYEMGPLEVRCVPKKFPVKDGTNFDGYQIQVRGIMNTLQNTIDASAVISLFDYTDSKYDPITTSLDFWQEKNSSAFQSLTHIGSLGYLVGYRRWIDLDKLIPDVLSGKRSGKRKIQVYVRIIPKETEQVELINLGLHQKELNILSSSSTLVEVNLKEKGYEESREEQILARALMVKFAVFVAFTDGKFNTQEGKIIQKWISKQIDIAYDNLKEQLKEALNSAFKEAFQLAEKDKLTLSKLITEFKNLTSYATNLSLMEFLIEVVGSDSKVSKEEMKAINLIATNLDIDQAQVKSISEKSFLNMKTDLETSSSLEIMLGIDEGWTKEEVLVHLNKEFAKWNGRIQALENEDEKNKAQKMLDAIAKARKKYGK